MIRAFPFLFCLTACAAPQTREVTVLVHGGEPFVMRDKGACVLVLGREVGYSELGRMVRECYREGK